MTSANKTSNLQLNQWSRTDPVNMDDFNADNAKIDAAVGENPMVRLFSVTVTTSVSTVELDLSGIDVTQYAAFRLFKDDGYASSSLYFRFNKLVTNFDWITYSNSSWQTTNGTNYAYFSSGFAEIFLGLPNLTCWDYSRAGFRPHTAIKASALETIDILADSNTTVTFPIGTRITLLGVKK